MKKLIIITSAQNYQGEYQKNICQKLTLKLLAVNFDLQLNLELFVYVTHVTDTQIC